MPTPDDTDDVKVGITRLEVSQIRLGTYQQALGPRLMARWELAWIGEQTEIEAMEREVKKEFKISLKVEIGRRPRQRRSRARGRRATRAQRQFRVRATGLV